MPTCFVIQPFDKGPFDKRFDDVVSPAIKAAGMEPYRVDRDPGASIPIEDIEAGIRGADLCVADITADNPNVWFELGFAIASQKDVVLIAAADRQRFPFDVQHRNIIAYSTDSSRDFAELQERITKRLRALLSNERRLGTAAAVVSPVAPLEGLAQYELVALIAVAQNLDNPEDSVSAYVIRKDMERAGFTRIAVTLALTGLLRKALVSSHDAYDDQTRETYTVYSLTSDGMDWLLANQDQLALQIPAKDTPF